MDPNSNLDILPPEAAPARSQPKYKIPNANTALSVITGADKLLLTEREKDRLVQDAYDRVPPNDPAEAAKNGEEWRTNVDWGDTENAINEKVELLNNLVMQSMPYIGFKTRYDTSLDTVQALEVVAAEHHFLFSESEFWTPETQNMLHQMVATGVGIFHHHIPYSWHFKSQPRCNLIYPPQATINPEEWPWVALRNDMDIVELIKILSNREASAAVGWDPTEIARLISAIPGVSGTFTDLQFSDWLNNPEAYVSAVEMNAIPIAGLAKQGLRCFTLYVREYDGKISESIVAAQDPTNTTGSYIFQRKYDEYTCMSDFISLFPLSVVQKYMEKVRGLGHRILPYAATINDFNNRAIDATILCGSLMLKDTPDSSGARSAAQLELGGLVTFIPEDMALDQRSFGNPADGFVKLSTMLRDRRESNNRMFGGTDKSANQPQSTATEMKLRFGEATRGLGFETDRFYNQLTIFYRANWKRLMYIYEKGDAAPHVRGYKEARDMWEEIKRRNVTKDDIKAIRSVYANSMFGDGDPNQVFLAIQDLQGPISRAPLTAQRLMDKMQVAARTRKPYLAEAMFGPSGGSADRDLSAQQWRTSQENNAFDSDSAVPIPVQDDDFTPVHVQEHTGYAEGVVASFEQQVLDPPSALKRLIKARDHTAVHLQVLARDPGQKQLLAQAQKRWQGIENMMNRMQQMIADAQAAEQARQMEEMRNPRLSVADQEKMLTEQARRDQIAQTAEMQRAEIARTEALKRDLMKSGEIAKAQIELLEIARPVDPVATA